MAVNAKVTTPPGLTSVLVALSDAMPTLVSIGGVKSNVTLLASSTVVSAVPEFPERSLKATLKVTGPVVPPASLV